MINQQSGNLISGSIAAIKQMKHNTGHWTNKNTNKFLNTLLQLFARSSKPLLDTHILSYELAPLPSHGVYQPCGRRGCPIFVYPPCSQHLTAVPTGAPGGASTPPGEVLACCPHTTRLLPRGRCAAQPGQGRLPWRHPVMAPASAPLPVPIFTNVYALFFSS